MKSMIEVLMKKHHKKSAKMVLRLGVSEFSSSIHYIIGLLVL
jgi:hypothetical protein